MILQALIAYAERENLGDADFASVAVHWLIPLDNQGKLTGGPIPLLENPQDQKPKPKVFLRPFTSPNELNQGNKSHFLCDTLERTTLWLDPKTPEKAPARHVQHDYFQNLLKEAANACPDITATLEVVGTFLQQETSLAELHHQLHELKAKPSDNATFSVDGNNLLDIESLKTFWRERRRRIAAQTKSKTPRVCIATGELAETLNTTEKIKGIPGGLPTGTNLISFDKDAFRSFGLEQAQNAAISAPAELKFRSALNTLIEKSKNQQLLMNDTVHLHWTRQPIDYDPMDILANADEEAVASLIKSIHAGQPVVTLDTNAYYALSLSGNGGRIMVRNWLESTVSDVQSHITKWFKDIGIVTLDGVGVKRNFKLYTLLFSLVRQKLEELPPQIATQLFYSALNGTPLPQSVLAIALRRQQLDQENKLHPARLALIKSCLLRSPNTLNNHPSTNNTTMTESLNSESRDPAYLCGQLFAVFDRLQFLAQGTVNAGVVERYYASASVTPALVMGRLFRNAQFHLAKIGGGIAGNATKDLESITSALGDAFPTTLDLEGQGRFALGYYHQKAEYHQRSVVRKEEQEQPAAITNA